jgi:hypothetical protein
MVKNYYEKQDLSLQKIILPPEAVFSLIRGHLQPRGDAMTGTDNNAKVAQTTKLVAWRRIFWTHFILGYSQPQQYLRELGIKDRRYLYNIELFNNYYSNIKVTGKKNYECYIDPGISGLLRRNPFFNIFLGKNITDSELSSLFSILLCCEKNDFHEVEYIFSHKGILQDEFQEDKDDKALRNKISQLERNGILISTGLRLVRKDQPRVHLYLLSDKTPENVFLLNKITSTEERESWIRHFNSFLDFFSMAGYFGELGFYIKNALSSTLPRSARNTAPDPGTISFKHAFCAQTLNDEIAWYTLIAIKNRQVVEFTALESEEALYTYSDQNKIIVTMLPLKILTSCFKGRRYVFGYIITERRYLAGTEMSSPRSGVADSILFDRITAIRLPKTKITAPDIPEDLYETAIKWGTRTVIREPDERKKYGPRDNGLIEINFNIKIKNDADRDPERNHSIRRLRRECRNGTVEITKITGDTMYAVYRTEAQDEDELQSWVKTYLGRISGLKTRRERFRKIFFGDLNKMLRLYGIDVPEDELSGKVKSVYHQDPEDDDSENNTESNKCFNTSTADPGIFSEYYGIYVEITRRILNACWKHNKIKACYPLKRDISHIIVQTTESFRLKNKFKLWEYYEKNLAKILFPNYAKTDTWKHLKLNPDIRLDHPIEFPLTRAELSWLYTALKDPLAELFFTADEYQKIQSDMLPFLKEPNRNGNPNTGAEELWKPGSLFDPDTRDTPFVIIDAEKEGDPVVTPGHTPEARQNYIRNFRLLREAISQRKFASVTYTPVKNGVSRKIDLAPLRLEFSLKNAKFRLFAVNAKEDALQNTTINLATVSSVEILKTCPWNPAIEDTGKFLEDQKRDFRFAVVRVTQDRNSIVRFLTEFSFYDKRACFDEKTGTCLVKLLYPEADWREIVIRILGFGAMVKLESGAAFLALLKRKGIRPEKLDFTAVTVTEEQDDYQRLLNEIKERIRQQLVLYSRD